MGKGTAVVNESKLKNQKEKTPQKNQRNKEISTQKITSRTELLKKPKDVKILQKSKMIIIRAPKREVTAFQPDEVESKKSTYIDPP